MANKIHREDIVQSLIALQVFRAVGVRDEGGIPGRGLGSNLMLPLRSYLFSELLLRSLASAYSWCSILIRILQVVWSKRIFWFSEVHVGCLIIGSSVLPGAS